MLARCRAAALRARLPSLSATIMSASNSLPPFDTSSSKVTQAPDPEWTLGRPATATEQGRKWAEEEKLGWKTVDVKETDPKLIYSLCTSGIVPRPVAFVSTIAEDGAENLAPFSWFNQVSTNPPVLSVTFTDTPRHKDSGHNILATKGFTVNIISEPWVSQANACSIDAPPGVSEWALSGLTKEPSMSVKPARVKESAFSMECELLQNVEIKDPDSGAVKANMVLGTIKYIHIRNAVMNERGTGVDPAKLKPICRLGGVSYAKLGDTFRVPRLSWAEFGEEVQKNFIKDSA